MNTSKLSWSGIEVRPPSCFEEIDDKLRAKKMVETAKMFYRKGYTNCVMHVVSVSMQQVLFVPSALYIQETLHKQGNFFFLL
jgi:hypothetical protein